MEYQGAPLKMFEFDCPFDRLEDPKSRELLGAILALRKQGYLSHHNYGVLPTDTYDFVGTHFGVYAETSKGIQVLMSYRIVELERCKEFKLVYPMEAILTNSNAVDHLRVFKAYAKAAQEKQVELNYEGSWTISPDIRSNAELFQYVYNLFFAMNTLGDLEKPTQIKLACGSLRLKTVKPIQYLGYRYFSEDQNELPSFKQSNLNNEDVMALSLHRPEAEVVAKAKVFELLWRNRMIIDRPTERRGTDRKIA